MQDQILTTLENLESILPAFSYVVLKGKQNYISLKALKGELDWLAQDPTAGFGLSEERMDHGMAMALAILCGWVGQTPSGDWQTCAHRRLSSVTEAAAGSRWGVLRWKLRVTTRPGPVYDRLDKLDFHRRALARLKTAHVAVLNHALLASGPELAEGRFDLIVDEAHNLERLGHIRCH